MNKFISSITGNVDHIKATRAAILEASTRNQSIAQINFYNDKINELRLKIEDHTDLAPDNAFDLKVGSNFDPKTWVQELHRLSTEIYGLNIKLRIAQEIYTQWFTEPEMSQGPGNGKMGSRPAKDKAPKGEAIKGKEVVPPTKAKDNPEELYVVDESLKKPINSKNKK